MNTEPLKAVLNLLHLAEKLKSELRHSWLSSGRQESVAEHTWRSALMIMLLQPYLRKSINLERTLKLMLIHDLVEAEAGDIPVFETGDRKAQKAAKEKAAIENIRSMLGGGAGQELYDLFFEFEHAETDEAKFAQAIDKIEAQIQHNESDLSTWLHSEKLRVFFHLDRYAKHDPALIQFFELVKDEAYEKLAAGGEDVEKLRTEAEAGKRV